MSNFLENLAARAIEQAPILRPRVTALYEPVTPAAGIGVPSLLTEARAGNGDPWDLGMEEIEVEIEPDSPPLSTPRRVRGRSPHPRLGDEEPVTEAEESLAEAEGGLTARAPSASSRPLGSGTHLLEEIGPEPSPASPAEGRQRAAEPASMAHFTGHPIPPTATSPQEPAPPRAADRAGAAGPSAVVVAAVAVPSPASRPSPAGGRAGQPSPTPRSTAPTSGLEVVEVLRDRVVEREGEREGAALSATPGTTRRPATSPPVKPREIVVASEQGSAEAPALAPESVVQITIGRVEVRAAPGAATPRARPPATVMGLDEYLRRRGGGR